MAFLIESKEETHIFQDDPHPEPYFDLFYHPEKGACLSLIQTNDDPAGNAVDYNLPPSLVFPVLSEK